MIVSLPANCVLGEGAGLASRVEPLRPGSSQPDEWGGSFVSAHADIARAATTHVTARIWRANGRPDVGGRRNREFLRSPFPGP